MSATHLSGRTLARSLALQLLFQAEATKQLVSEVLEHAPLRDDELVARYQKELDSRDFSPEEAERELAELDAYARELALGVDGMLHDLDAVIGQASANWSVARMPAVDRNLLRIALYEMFCEDAVDTSVAIDECVGLAHAYGTDDSYRFVNGLLGKVARRLEAGEDVLATAVAAQAEAEAAEAERAAALAEETEELVADEADMTSAADVCDDDVPAWAQE